MYDIFYCMVCGEDYTERPDENVCTVCGEQMVVSEYAYDTGEDED